MFARQFPIDKASLIQPLMRAKLPRHLVDRKFLSAYCLACAHSAGPNHVSTHDVKAHSIKDFCVVRNRGHRIATFFKSLRLNGPIELPPTWRQVDP
jgi:hypothetical protein